MRFLGRLLSSRITLGICAVVLAGSAIVGRVSQAPKSQVDRQTSQQECRSDIGGVLDVQVARSLLRIELALGAIDKGESYSDVIAESEAITKPGGVYEKAIHDRENAVSICSKEKP